MPKIKFEGAEELLKKLKANVTLDDVKKTVKKNGREMQQKIQSNAKFTKGYQTGTTKRSVGLEIKDGGLTAESGAETEYAPYLEFGTRFMEAQPFIRPAFDEQKKQFQNDMNKLVR